MLRRDDFGGFFSARTKALLELISKAMGKSLTVEPFEASAEEYKNNNGKGFHQSIPINQ
jgi:hypothetical protein